MYKKEAKYNKLGKKLIQDLPEFEYIRESNVRIAFLSSDKEKTKQGKLILGTCTRVDEKYKWCCPYDFFITIYEPNVIDLNWKQIMILMKHELHHVGISTDGNEEGYYLIPHDVEEFDNIIDQHGLRWAERTNNA